MTVRNATKEEKSEMEVNKFDLIAKLHRCVDRISDLQEDVSFLRLAKIEIERQIRKMETEYDENNADLQLLQTDNDRDSR